MWTPDCNKIYKKSIYSRTSTRNFLISQGIIDQYNNILDLNALRGAIQFIKSKTQYPLGDQKIISEQGNKVVFNDKLFEKIDAYKRQPSTKYQLAQSELSQLKPISEQFDKDISEFNQFRIRDKQREEKGETPENKDYFATSKFLTNYTFKLGTPSSILQSVGMPNLPIILNSNWFSSHILDDPKHNLKALNFKGLVEAIHNPIAIFRDKNYRGEDGRIEMLTTIKGKDGKPVNVVLEFKRRFGNLLLNSITTAFEVKEPVRFIAATLAGDTQYIDKERITAYLQGFPHFKEIVYPKSGSDSRKSKGQGNLLSSDKSDTRDVFVDLAPPTDSSTKMHKFLWKVKNFPEKLTNEQKRYQLAIATGDESQLPQSIEENTSLQEGLEWAKKVMPNADIELVKGLIDNVAKGSFNTITDIIQASEQYADKGTIKHEIGHLAFKYLPKEQQEELLNEGSKLFNIPRGETDTNIEEKIMEQIEKSPDQFVPKSAIGKFIQKIKNWLSDIFKNRSNIDIFVRNLNQGLVDVPIVNNYNDLLSINPNTDVTYEEFNDLTPEEQEILLYQEKNC